MKPSRGEKDGGPKARPHTSLGQRPRGIPDNHHRGLKARSIARPVAIGPECSPHLLEAGRLPLDCRRQRGLALRTFRYLYEVITNGLPSGETTWDLSLSPRPQDWRLLTRTSAGETQHGPNGNLTRTNLHVAACFSPQIIACRGALTLDPATLGPYELPFAAQAIYDHSDSSFLLLGYHELEAFAPAQRVFQVHIGLPHQKYRFTSAIRWVLQRDSFEYATELLDPTRAARRFTLHIRNHALARLTA